MQGCPLRCICCHNPDTWDFAGGSETTVEELVARILRYRNYFGEQGGVTVDGEKVTDIKTVYTKESFGEEGLVVKRGKKSFKRVVAK